MTNDEMVEKARAEFEKWGASPSLRLYTDTWNGQCYTNSEVQLLWEAWQTGARSAVRDALREAIRIADDEDYGCIGAEIAAALLKKFEVEG